LLPLWALGNNRIGSSQGALGRNGLAGYSARRSPGTLRLHPVFLRLNLAAWLINSELQGKPSGIREPILVTTRGILVSGFADWHVSVCAGQAEIDCTEFPLEDDEALQLVLSLHRPRAGWNAFIRTELALQQEPYFKSNTPGFGRAGWIECFLLAQKLQGRRRSEPKAIHGSKSDQAPEVKSEELEGRH
jgi:hypothetical protein